MNPLTKETATKAWMAQKDKVEEAKKPQEKNSNQLAGALFKKAAVVNKPKIVAPPVEAVKRRDKFDAKILHLRRNLFGNNLTNFT